MKFLLSFFTFFLLFLPSSALASTSEIKRLESFYNHALELKEEPISEADRAAELEELQYLADSANERSAAALELPDIISIEDKVYFQDVVLPWVQDLLVRHGVSELERNKDNLVAKTRRLTPGANPLPAVREAIRLNSQAVLLDEEEKLALEALLRSDVDARC